MSIIICPGIHEPVLTESFISGCLARISERSIGKNTDKILIFPEQGYLTLSAFHILHFLGDRLKYQIESPVIFISFSAGVVGAIVAASGWQLLGGNVKAFIAIDGWGVPLVGNFPIHRMSHDYFTHWSSSWLLGGENNFYAEPAVDHLSMWRTPQTVQGWWVNQSGGISPRSNRLSAAEFLHLLLTHYQENSPENRFGK